MQFCNCEICTNQACSRLQAPRRALRHYWHLFSDGKGGPSKILEQNLSPEAISEHFCILIGETLKFFMTYVRKRDKVDLF